MTTFCHGKYVCNRNEPVFDFHKTTEKILPAISVLQTVVGDFLTRIVAAKVKN